ncbi:mannitol-1-phosphate/altronate dehydrogenase, partial [Rhizobium leguminosarum]|nr:mannitol-1-phosphate/altronate dehydrogenase [Rhizobium leguminosarum]MBB4353460.1 mannitol-1-phosphate/altronate dehydrogenase [Rhizobium leguminosarum]
MTERLQTLSGLAPTAKLPAYDRNQLKSGILHLGPGAFFRAHFAPFTDAALATSGGDRAGSVCLNSFGRFAKWISASIMPPPSLVSAR